MTTSGTSPAPGGPAGAARSRWHARPAADGGAPAWLAPAAVGAGTAAATLLLALRSPHEAGSYGMCPSLLVAGVWCPACGGLRAVHELAHLDVAGAWAMNPLFVLSVPVLGLLWAWWVARALGLVRAVRVPRAVPWVVLTVVLLFGVLRNVPALAPWLAPGV